MIKKMMKIGVVITLSIFVYGGIKTFFNNKKDKKENLSLEISGIIDEIKISQNHATPTFLIKGEWEYLGSYGRAIRSFAMVGDSIVKKENDNPLYVFRKNELGKYQMVKEVKPY